MSTLMAAEDSPEDILSSSLESIYSYTPISFSGESFTHKQSGLTLVSPDTAPSNWALHASSIWMSSLFLANHICDIKFTRDTPSVILELGACAGLPGILVAKRMGSQAIVTLSDYPDDSILRCLHENIKFSISSLSSVRVVGHIWGECTAKLGTFDIVLAADTLWNPDQHLPFCQTLSRVLKRDSQARIYLVAGLHTGRWTISRFLDKLAQFDLVIEFMTERKVDGTFDLEVTNSASFEREWQVERDGEGEDERRKWVVWIVLKWSRI
ncbi:hypothetical protein K439DRAFT_1632709 [Ramaria rubella]|nr:hypothetical protein K439DRAFT_1632709 [Ramaria rubella]